MKQATRLPLQTGIMIYIAIALGSMAGSLARWGASVIALDLDAGLVFPWDTLAVNGIGSFLIGYYAAIAGKDGRRVAGNVEKHFIMTGFCGGYTTFSIFSFETLRLYQEGLPDMALLNIALSLFVWIVAVWAGYRLGMTNASPIKDKPKAR